MTQLSRILRDLPGEEPMCLSDLSDRMGNHAHAMILVVLAAPELIPLTPSIAPLLAIPMLLTAVHMGLHGERRALPQWLGRRKVPAAMIRVLRDRVAGWIGRLEGVTRRRWPALADRARLVGWVTAGVALVLLVPLPFVNTPPAVCVILMALGLMLRDGLLVALGLGLTVIVGAVFALLAVMGWDWLTSLI